MKRGLSIGLVSIACLVGGSISFAAPATVSAEKEFSIYNGHGVDFSSGLIKYQTIRAINGSPDTFEALIKVNKETKGVVGSILSDRNYGVGNFTDFGINENGNLTVYWNAGEGYFVFDSVDLRTSKFEAIAFVRDEINGKVHFYHNGVLKQSFDSSLRPNKPRGPFYIGSDYGGWVNNKVPFKGEIAAINIYREALLANEIAADASILREIDGGNKGAKLLFAASFDRLLDAITDKSLYHCNCRIGSNDYFYEGSFYDTEDYTFAIAGDPQCVVEHNLHDIFGNNINYLIDVADSKKIEMFWSVGDMVNGMSTKTSDAHWAEMGKYSSETLFKLDGKVPYFCIPGNHDYDLGCSVDHGLTKYNTYFPYSKFSNFAYFGGAYQVGQSQNTYYLKEVCGVKYIFFALDFCPSDDVMTWLGNKLDEYSDRRAIIVTHGYLGTNGFILEAGDPDSGSQYGWKGKSSYNDPIDMFNKTISKHENVFMVSSGHVPVDDIVVSESVGEHGNVILNVLIDDQGIGMNDMLEKLLGFLTFNEKEQTIGFDYYSSYCKKHFNLQNHFTYSFKGNTKILSSLYYDSNGNLKEGA